MTTSRPADSGPPVRPELVTRVTEYLRQYPQDLVDTTRLIQRFELTAEEFEHALLRTQEQAEEIALLPPAPGPALRPDRVQRLVAHLRRYPQDLVDAKRLLKRLRTSPEEFEHALQRIDGYRQSA